MNSVIKSILLSGFLIASLPHSNAETFPPNFEIPSPVWGPNNRSAPIAWGDCIPVPVAPINMHQPNMSMGNMPFPQGIPMPAAPMYNQNQANYRLPPPSPFFNGNPMAMPQTLANTASTSNNNANTQLQALQNRYDKASEASRNKIAELMQALEDAQNQISDSQTMITEAPIDNSALKERISTLENQLKTSNEKQSSLDKQLTSDKTAQMLKNTQDKQAIANLEKELADLKNSNIQLKSELSTAENNIGSQARMLTSLKQNSAEFTALKSTYKERNDENAALKEQLSTIDDQYKTLKSQFETLTAQTSSQSRKLTALNQSANEFTALKSAYKERNDENAKLKEQLSALDSQHKTLKSQYEALSTQTSSQTRKLTALSQSTNELTALKSAYKERNGEVLGLKEQLAKLTNDHKTLKAELTTTQSMASSQARKLTALGQSSAELTALQSAYKERNDENILLKNKLAQIEKEQTTITQKNAQDSDTLEALKKKLESNQNENITLKSQLDTAISNASSQARKITTLNQSAAELTAIQSAYKERSEEIATLKIKLEDYKNMQTAMDASMAKSADCQSKLTESVSLGKSLQGKIASLETTGSNQARKITALMVTTSELDAIKSAYKDLSSKKVELSSKLEAATADTDNDGIVDNNDKCPTSPAGSAVNSQGCPDIEDADKDGVADANDLCPSSLSGATVNEFGCTPSENITLKGVTFATGSSRLTATSLPIINAAAATLKTNPNLNVEVAGYTDNQGLAVINKRLSQRRANSVMIQLIKQDINAERLTAKGYGEKNPVAANDTEEGRANNRRVELIIRN